MNTFKIKFAFAFLSPFSGETIMRTFSYLLAAAFFTTAIASAEPLMQTDLTGSVTGKIVESAGDGRWMVVEITETNPAREDLVGKQMRMRVTYGAGMKPNPEQCAAVLAWVKAGEPVTVGIRPTQNDMVMQLKTEAVPGGGGKGPAANGVIAVDITGKVVANNGPRSFTVKVEKIDPAEGHEDLIGQDLNIMSRWDTSGPRADQVEAIKAFEVGKEVTVSASGPLNSLRLNLTAGERKRAAAQAKAAAGPQPTLDKDTATRPADANNPERLARQTNEKIITGASVDESKVEVTIYVDANKGDDKATGTEPGTPVKTFEQGVARAMKQLADGRGVRVLLQEGFYSPAKTVEIDGKGSAKSPVLIIEGAAKGKVVISGAQAEGFEPEKWELVDAERKIYRVAWPHNWPMVNRGYYSLPQVVLHRRELLEFNGKRMEMRLLDAYSYVDKKGREYNEAGLLVKTTPGVEGGYTFMGFQGLDKLEPGEFSVQTLGPGDQEFDAKPHPYPDSVLFRLPDGVSSLKGNQVAMGMRNTLLTIRNKENLVLRNLSFRHANGYYNGPGGAAVQTERWGGPINSRNWLIEGCEFTENGVSGLDLFSVHDVTIRNTDVTNNGARGLHTIRVQNGRFEDMNVTGNNSRGFKLGLDWVKHVAGGWDYRLVDCLFLRVNASENHGHAFRGDVLASNLIFRDCKINRNTTSGGMMQEISFGPILVDNCEFIGNKGHAILILNVHDMTIQNSRFIDNNRGLWMVVMPKRNTVADMDLGVGGEEGSGPNIVPIPQSLNTVVRNCVFTAGGESGFIERSNKSGNPQQYVEWYSKQYIGENNTFWNPDRKEVFNIDPVWDPRTFTDLAGWQKATGQDADSKWDNPADGQ
jgi:hypothetical protein